VFAHTAVRIETPKKEFATGVRWWSAMNIDRGAKTVRVAYVMSRFTQILALTVSPIEGKARKRS